MTSNSQPSATVESPRTLRNVWIVLLALAAGSYMVAEKALTGENMVYVALALAFVKMALVTGVFMELYHRGRGFLWIALALFATTLGLMAWAWS